MIKSTMVRAKPDAIEKILDDGWGYDLLAQAKISKASVSKLKRGEAVQLSTLEKFANIVSVTVESLVDDEFLEIVRPSVTWRFHNAEPNRTVLAKSLRGFDYVELLEDHPFAEQSWRVGTSIEKLEGADQVHELLEELDQLTNQFEVDAVPNVRYQNDEILVTLELEGAKSDSLLDDARKRPDRSVVGIRGEVTSLKHVGTRNSALSPEVNIYEMAIKPDGSGGRSLKEQLTARKVKKRIADLFGELAELGADIRYAPIVTGEVHDVTLIFEDEDEEDKEVVMSLNRMVRCLMVMSAEFPPVKVKYTDPALNDPRNPEYQHTSTHDDTDSESES